MIGKLWAGRFEILRPLGEGREGRVFVARDCRDNSEVALKLLHRMPDRLEKLEGARLREVQHPHLVRVLEVGLYEETAYLTQELILGGSLRGLSFPLPAEALEVLAEQMLAALGFLHGQGMLHGDVKPENIFVIRQAPWEFKLGDFGLSRRSVDVSSGVTRGTPAFMPPEIIRGEPDDERSDFYALGITLYECAFAELPFQATRLRDLFAQHLDEQPGRFARPGNLAGSLLRLLRSLLSKDPALRPRTAAAARSLLHGEPITVLDWVPPSLGVLLGREDEQQTLFAALQGERSCISVEGPEGIGKSRLLREFALDVQLQGITPWSWDEEGLHGSVGDVSVQTELQSSDPRGLAASQALELRRVLGEGSWLLIVDQFESRSPQFCATLAVFLRDQASHSQKVQLVCVAGRESVGQFLEDTLVQAGLPPGAAIFLAPWSQSTVRAATAALLGATQLEEEVVHLIESATGGVPSGVESVVRQLVKNNALRVDSNGAVALGLSIQPEDLDSQWMQSALEDLQQSQRTVLCALALLKSLASEAVLDRIVGFACEEALGDLHAKGLIRGITRQDQILYRTSHEGIQRAVLRDMQVREKARLHDRVTALLQEDAATLPGEDVLWHQCCGSDLQVATAALHELQQQLSGARPDLLRQACNSILANWPPDKDPSGRALVEVEFLRTLIQLGEFEVAGEQCETALQNPVDPQIEQNLRNLWSDALSAQGRAQEALRVLGEPEEGRAGLEGLQRKVVVLTLLGRWDDALRICEKLQMALDPDDELAHRVVDARVDILRELEELDKAHEVLSTAIERISKSQQHAALGGLWMRLGQVEFGRGRMAEARKMFDAALLESQRTGDRVGMARAMTGLGVTQAESGEFSAAHDTFLGAFDLLRRLGESVNAINILGNLGQMLLVQGLYGKSLDYATRGVSLASQRTKQGVLIRIRIIRAGVLAKLGAESDVVEELDRVLGVSESERYEGQVLAVRAELHLHEPDSSAPDETLQEALQLFEKHRIADEQLRVLLLIAHRHHLAGRQSAGLEVVDAVSKGAARLRLPDLVVEAEVLRAEFLARENPPLAKRRIMRTLILARELNLRESMWRGEALLATLNGEEDPVIAVQHYQRCLDLFREMTEGLPKALAATYLQQPRQQAILSQLRRLSESH